MIGGGGDRAARGRRPRGRIASANRRRVTTGTSRGQASAGPHRGRGSAWRWRRTSVKGFSAARTAVCPSAVNVGTSQPCSVNGGRLIAVTAATPGAASSDQDYLIRGTAACRGASAYSDGSESFDEHQPIVGHPGVHLLQPDTPTRAPGRRGDDHHAASAHLRLHRPATPYVPYCTYYLFLYLSGAEYKYSVDRGAKSIAFQIVASWPRPVTYSCR